MTVEDLSSRLPGGNRFDVLAVDAMDATNQCFESAGMAGPGGHSVAVDPSVEQPPPHIDVTDAGRLTTTSPLGERDTSPWVDAHSVGSHPAWHQAADQESPGGAQSPRDGAGRWVQS